MRTGEVSPQAAACPTPIQCKGEQLICITAADKATVRVKEANTLQQLMYQLLKMILSVNFSTCGLTGWPMGACELKSMGVASCLFSNSDNCVSQQSLEGARHTNGIMNRAIYSFPLQFLTDDSQSGVTKIYQGYVSSTPAA